SMYYWLGVSVSTQILHSVMFVARYLDIFTGMYVSLYTIIMKVFYILGSFATVFILLLAFWTTATTPNEKRIVRTIVYTVLTCFVLGMVFHYGDNSNFTEIWWAFSIYLDAVADIPQLVEYYNSEERDTTLTACLILIFTSCIFQALSWPLRYLYYGALDPIAVTAGSVRILSYLVLGISVMRQRARLESGAIRLPRDNESDS
ncbi:uncharacterized protein STEHIDRAFT_65713, partial [Stereum hirsutum FP-91666 SS1]|uniref:uncharacterized protein n=1 Tax=Stereum hirsutum (strain FP-91666) TaxID=721885 RepID=UPI000444A270